MTEEKLDQYDNLNADDELFRSGLVESFCEVIIAKNYGGVRLATALVKALEKRDEVKQWAPSTLAAALRQAIEAGAF